MAANINIVSNSKILKKFERIDIFKLDLGINLLGGNGKDTIKIIDEFIKEYKNNGGRIIHAFGNIGSLKFYMDPSIDTDTFQIHKNGQIFEISYEETQDMKKYLSEILIELDKHQKEEERIVEEMKKAETQLWVATDPKNYGKKYEIDQRLSREEYLEEIIKRKTY